MNNNRNIFQELKQTFLQGKMTHRLIIVNVAVFILIQIYLAIFRLGGLVSEDLPNTLFTLDTNLTGFLHKPWGLITSIFAHFDLFHLFSNMLFLYFSGKFFEQIWSGKQLLITYILGGIFGGIAEIAVQSTFYSTENNGALVIGASGSIMAIFIAVAFHSPQTQLLLFGKFSIRLYFLAIFFLIQDIIGIGTKDTTAHFAHIGGALFGILSIVTTKFIPAKSRNSKGFFNQIFKSSKKKTVTPRFKSDEAYNQEKRTHQQKTDSILDKISKGGYESLNQSEKDFLFKQSKNGK
jgi:membrane associated rhomboid family serine protease